MMKSTQEVTSLLRICRQTMSKLINNEEIHTIKIRRKKYVSDEELERLNLNNDVPPLKVKEAADELGTSSQTIYRMIREGQIETVPVSVVQRIPLKEIKRIKNEGTM